MCTVVQKYGGSSLSTIEKVRRVADRVAATHHEHGPFVVVVSARGNTTDELLALAARLGDDTGHGREIDQLLSTGEIASAAQLALAVTALGVDAISMSGPQAGITVTGPHGSGVIETINTQRLREALAAGRVVVVGGFQGADADGDVVTLGRGGSDTTAVALAVALDAARCEIYTDVDGVHSVDPRLVSDARKLSHVDSDLMTELAFAGAKVLHARSAELAAAHHMEVHVRDAAGDTPGTVIASRPIETADAITGITCDAEIARLLVHSPQGNDLSPEVLQIMSDSAVPIDLVARSGPHEDEFRMGFTVSSADLAVIREPVLDTVTRRGGTVVIDEDVSKVSLVGTGLMNRPGYVARMTAALAAGGIATSWVALSQSRASVTVARPDADRAVRLLHTEFLTEHTSEPSAELTAG